MIDIFLFLAGMFLFTFVFGSLLERIHVPWIFAALIAGAIISMFSYFSQLTSSGTFIFIANLGMYLLLFIIGFDIDLKKMARKGKFLFGATFFIISFEALFGGIVFHFVFGYSWLLSFILGFSFATVGEVVLVPILDEFKMINTRLGQSILGIGLLDDIIEIAVLIVLAGVVSVNVGTKVNIWVILASLLGLFALSFFLTKIKKKGVRKNFGRVEMIFLFSIFMLFLFLGIGEYAKAAPLAAFLAGISLRTFIPKKRLALIEKEIRAVAYGFFAPVFFFWVGTSMDLQALVSSPLLLLLVIAVSSTAKIVGSRIISGNYLSSKESLIMGIGLCVRFSTSIIIVKILFDSGLLGKDLYSILIASSVILTLIVPIVFSRLVAGLKKEKGKNGRTIKAGSRRKT